MDVIERFGQYIQANCNEKPEHCRKLIVLGLKAFGVKLSRFPDKRLPASRQYIATLVNKAVVRTLTHPQTAVLTSVFMPGELLFAMGLDPMCAELYGAFMCGCHCESAFAQAAEAEGLAETFCSYHKILMGSAYTHVLPEPRFIVNTSLACDANNLTFRALSRLYDVPQFYVDVPPSCDEQSVAYVAQQLRDLTRFLETQTGRRLDEARLREAMVHTQKTIELFEEAMELKKDHVLPSDTTSEMYEIYTTLVAMGTEKAEKYARMLVEDLKKAPSVHGTRILWVHTIPFWQKAVNSVFNYSEDASIITCDMNYSGFVKIDPDHPYESMARRLVFSAFNAGGQRRVEAAVEKARQLDADGAVVFCHWGCKQTMGLSMRFKQELEKAGVPVLILNGDGCDRKNSSDGQIATRLNAFMEMLKGERHA